MPEVLDTVKNWHHAGRHNAISGTAGQKPSLVGQESRGRGKLGKHRVCICSKYLRGKCSICMLGKYLSQIVHLEGYIARPMDKLAMLVVSRHPFTQELPPTWKQRGISRLPKVWMKLLRTAVTGKVVVPRSAVGHEGGYIWASTASRNSSVVAVPPRSRVRAWPWTRTARTAISIRSAACCSLR